MGKIITEIIEEIPDIEIVYGIDPTQASVQSYPIFHDCADISLSCDVMIDFSHSDATEALITYCIDNHIALVSATTGLLEEQETIIQTAANQIPIFRTANTSLGVYVLVEMAKLAANILGTEYDIEIVEKHHNQKKDAPSGTAYMIADAINGQQNSVYTYVYGRDGEAVRSPNEIGIHAVRGGTIPGDHSVIFAGIDEIIELKHLALSKKIFARQAIRAAQFIKGKQARVYTMEDLVQNKK
ncbi:MAG: 4-hydroxy-tetrahydrodipicolinate reductase [Culicoidibacterales bacterium]